MQKILRETMNYHSKTQRLKEIFLGDLNGGRFNDNGPLPSTLYLADLYGASRNTIRKMLSELSGEGVLQRCANNRFTAIPASENRSGRRRRKTANIKRTVLGWFYSGSQDQLIVERTKGIERFVEENNLELRVITSVHGHESVLELLNRIQDCSIGIDGVIVANHPLPRYEETLKKLAQAAFPVVVACGQPPESCRVNVVVEDDFYGVYSATAYMLENYDCPVWCLGGAGNTEVRLNAFQTAMCDVGFVDESEANVRILRQEMDMPENWDMRQKMLLPGKLIRPFLSGLKHPVGIICGNDYIAFGVYKAAEELKLKIGRDILVTGFSNLPFAQRLSPPLTTVHVDYEKLGYQAAWLLYQQISGKITVPTKLLISAKMQKRLSC